MKFGKIIELCGFNSYQFKTAASIPIKLYNGNDEIVKKAHYAGELLSENTLSQMNFFNLLSFLEVKPVASMNIKIDEDHVTVFYKTPQAFSFRRSQPSDPMDRA